MNCFFGLVWFFFLIITKTIKINEFDQHIHFNFISKIYLVLSKIIIFLSAKNAHLYKILVLYIFHSTKNI